MRLAREAVRGGRGRGGRNPTAAFGHGILGDLVRRGGLLLLSLPPLPPPRMPLLALPHLGGRGVDIGYGGISTRRRGHGVVVAVAAVCLRKLLSEGDVDTAELLDKSLAGGLCHIPSPQPRVGGPEPCACEEDGTEMGIRCKAVPCPPRDGDGER